MKATLGKAVAATSAATEMAARADTQSVAVFARLRPVDSGEARGAITNTRTVLTIRNLEFEVGVMTESQTQDGLYSKVAHERVVAVLDGYNGTILAYGQTGSGKTHTMFGPEAVLQDFAGCDPAARGIVPRACVQLFSSVATSAEVRCSYIEVYNDRLHDLLSGAQGLPLQESAKGVTVGGLSYETVRSSAEVCQAPCSSLTPQLVRSPTHGANPHCRVVAHRLPPTTCHPPPATHRRPPTAGHPPSATHRRPPTTCYPPHSILLSPRR